jgi:hypothetical protein
VVSFVSLVPARLSWRGEVQINMENHGHDTNMHVDDSQNHASAEKDDSDSDDCFIGWNVRMSDLIEETTLLGRWEL